MKDNVTNNGKNTQPTSVQAKTMQMLTALELRRCRRGVGGVVTILLTRGGLSSWDIVVVYYERDFWRWVFIRVFV